MDAREPVFSPLVTGGANRFRRGFSLVELLVSVAIMLTLFAVSAGAFSAASGQQKRLRTRAVIAKIDSIVSAQYASYAGRNVEATTSAGRGEILRGLARGDLPDDWNDDVEPLASAPESSLTAHQRAYAAVWNALGQGQKDTIPDEHSSAECLFLAVMYGGLADCLDCDSLRIDVGDHDEDHMPEFLDAWGNPIGFVLEPANLRLPPDSREKFFSASLPFDPVVATTTEAKGGLMRPLIVSAGPDGDYGLEPDAAPSPGSNAAKDNLTNFDEEARR